MVERGMEQPMLSITGIYVPEIIKIAGPAANGTIVGVPKAQSNPKIKAMEEAYKAKGYSEAPSPYTKYAYEATNLLLDTIKRVGTKDKVAISKAIREANYEGVLGTTTFDEYGQTQVPVDIELRVVKDGQWTDY